MSRRDADDDGNDDYHPDRNERNDHNDFSYNVMVDDIKSNQKDNLKWLLEEFQLQFDLSTDGLSEKEKKSQEELAKKLVPYFLKSINDPSVSLRDFAKFGLEQIRIRFPNLIR